MQRSRTHNVEDGEKAGLIQDSPETRDLKLQLEQERVEFEAAAAISARRALACRVVAIGFIVLFVILFGFKVMTESGDQKREFSSSCMHALGGGATGSRGSLLHFDPRCTAELKEYFDQAYNSEVRRVSDQAIAYFRQQVMRYSQEEFAGGSRGTVIFDIDETALSNMDGFFGGSPWARFFGRGSEDRCVRPHLEYSALEPLRLKLVAATSGRGAGHPSEPSNLEDLLDGGEGLSTTTTTEAAGPRRPLCSSPPLRPTLDLYNFLYDNNYTVVFLTGRSEDAREETEANLAEAGYGTRCQPSSGASSGAGPVDTASAAVSSMAATDSYGSFLRNYRRAGRRRILLQQQQGEKDVLADTQQAQQQEGLNAEQRQQLQEEQPAGKTAEAAAGGGGGSARGLPFAGLFSPPAAPLQRCYAELVMRKVGDERLASVFKSEARSRLVAEDGHVLVGNIGDQFSDLVGQAAATANFKLPNPVYTLL